MNINKEIESLLTNLYALYMCSQHAHWNVTGCCFLELHKFYGDIYDAAGDDVDTIAELLRQRGEKVPSGMFANAAKLVDATIGDYDNDDYTTILFHLTTVAKETADTIAKNEESCAATIVTVSKVASGLSKTAWMLKSLGE